MDSRLSLNRLQGALTRLLLLVACGVVLGVWLCAGTAVQAREQRDKSVGEVHQAELPREARETLALIKRGGPFPYRKDGTVFQNRERRLPAKPRGYYREYTVRTPWERDRGARRIVAGKGETGDPATSGEYYYTDDHYETFRRIRE
jgi:ribonuclease T1